MVGMKAKNNRRNLQIVAWKQRNNDVVTRIIFLKAFSYIFDCDLNFNESSNFSQMNDFKLRFIPKPIILSKISFSSQVLIFQF